MSVIVLIIIILYIPSSVSREFIYIKYVYINFFHNSEHLNTTISK